MRTSRLPSLSRTLNVSSEGLCSWQGMIEPTGQNITLVLVTFILLVAMIGRLGS